MSELKRYDPSCDDVTIGSMDEELEGDYVEYADYARLKAAADEIQKALKKHMGCCVDCLMLANKNMLCAKCTEARAALAAYQEATR